MSPKAAACWKIVIKAGLETSRSATCRMTGSSCSRGSCEEDAATIIIADWKLFWQVWCSQEWLPLLSRKVTRNPYLFIFANCFSDVFSQPIFEGFISFGNRKSGKEWPVKIKLTRHLRAEASDKILLKMKFPCESSGGKPKIYKKIK